MNNNSSFDIDRLAKVYLIAKKYVINNGFSNEIDWQDDVSFITIDQQYFLREYTWVVLASGLSDKVVSIIFPKMQKIFKNWEDLDYIENNKIELKLRALAIFNNDGKINALFSTVSFIREVGFEYFKKEIQNNGLDYLKELSYIGQTTCFHLAKNIGLSFAKPDRHLMRVSESIGFDTPHDLCSVLSEFIDEKIQVVDLVIWRYATLDKNYAIKLKHMVFNEIN